MVRQKGPIVEALGKAGVHIRHDKVPAARRPNRPTSVSSGSWSAAAMRASSRAGLASPKPNAQQARNFARCASRLKGRWGVPKSLSIHTSRTRPSFRRARADCGTNADASATSLTTTCMRAASWWIAASFRRSGVKSVSPTSPLVSAIAPT